MRVISQDGTIDIPYDYFSLTIANGKYEDVEVACIYCYNLSSPKGTKLAEYSRKEKAEKAMEMLRDTYQHGKRVSVPKFDESGIADEDDLLLYNTRFINDCLSGGVRVQSKYFQFPKDEDVEV